MGSTLTINTNLASLGAQRRLAQSTATLRQSFERLSSGLRINNVSDDAAGLSIASELKVGSRVLAQGLRNINDGISLVQIAESAGSALSTIVIRLEELSHQSANGTLSTVQRRALDDEGQALRSEFNRIVQTVEFNGLKPLNAGSQTLDIQAGYSVLSLASTKLTASVSGDGTFKAPTSVSGSGFYAAADVDGDQIADLINGAVTGFVVRRGLGDGTFGAAVTFTTPTATYFGSTTFADFNNDGFLDFAYGTAGVPDVQVALGNGDGSFRAVRSQVIADGASPYVYYVDSGDVNSDGKIDLVATDDNNVYVFSANGDGTFKAGVSYIAFAGGAPQASKLADMNNDGRLDIVVASGTNNSVGVMLGNGNGSFVLATQVVISSAPTSAVVVSDLNGDGKLDLVTHNGTGNVLAFLGDGAGSFAAPVSYAASAGVYTYSLAGADFNGDGFTDLAVTYPGSGVVQIVTGNGDGSFRAPISYVTLGDYVPLTADFNNDGATDLLIGDVNVNPGLLFGNTDNSPFLSAFTLRTLSGSRLAITKFAVVRKNLGSSIGGLGSSLSRLHVAYSNLSQSQENYEGAASRILDVDVAHESAQLAKTQILQQAGAAILAQANQQPALALRVLQGVR